MLFSCSTLYSEDGMKFGASMTQRIEVLIVSSPAPLYTYLEELVDSSVLSSDALGVWVQIPQ